MNRAGAPTHAAKAKFQPRGELFEALIGEGKAPCRDLGAIKTYQSAVKRFVYGV